jgi:hypothetical protein
MSATLFQQLLHAAFRQDVSTAVDPADMQAYQELQRAAPREQGFRFERLRLLVAMSLMKALADLGDHDESRQVQQVLHRALTARSIEQIDAIITKETQHFERLYTDLYVNDEGEQLLHLFERTLDADTMPAMDAVIQASAELVDELDFDAPHDDED